MPAILNRNFDARNKHGREIVDHYRQTGKEGFDLFLRAARNHDLFSTQNRNGLGDVMGPKHLLATQARYAKGRSSVAGSVNGPIVDTA